MSTRIRKRLVRITPLTTTLALAFASACTGDSLPLDESNSSDATPSTAANTGGGGLGDQGLPLKTIELISDAYWMFGDAAIVGDLDGDGYDDWTVVSDGVPSDRSLPGPFGAVHLFYGRASYPDVLELTDADFVMEGAGGVEALGDIDGDGYPDLGFPSSCVPIWPGEPNLCGDPTAGLHLIYGGPERYAGKLLSSDVGVHWKPDLPNGYVRDVHAAGDLNGDGRDDIVFGLELFHLTEHSLSWEFDRSILLFGRATRSEQAPEPGFADAYFKDLSGDFSGGPFAGAGDVDGDGYSDLALTEWNHPTDPCTTQLFYGGPGSFEGAVDLSDADASFEACGADAKLGDLDQDGFADLGLADLNGNSPLHLIHGQAERFSGFHSVQDAEFSPDTAETRIMGVGAGDINGNGYPDLVVTKAARNSLDDAHGSALLLLHGGPDRFEDNWVLPSDVIPQDQVVLYGQAGEIPVPPHQVIYSLTGMDSGGDVNGDGYDDILVVGLASSAFDGRVYLLLGGPIE